LEQVSCARLFAIEEQRKNPNHNDRSYDKKEEIFDKAFDWIFGMSQPTAKKPGQSEKEWWRNSDRNEESAKPTTAQQSERS
jgi:hypothetical protein